LDEVVKVTDPEVAQFQEGDIGWWNSMYIKGSGVGSKKGAANGIEAVRHRLACMCLGLEFVTNALLPSACSQTIDRPTAASVIP
jgi:hypothetical protein